MKIGFIEKTHTYTVDGDIAYISVTELLAKHRLAPDYSKADKGDLKAKREKGKEIHADLEKVLNMAKYEPTTAQGQRFAEWVSKNVSCGVGEQPLALDYKGMIIAGTSDLMFFLKNGDVCVGDHKCVASVDKEYVSWQVSLYDYFARKLKGRVVNGVKWNWKGANKFYCFHHTDDEMKIVELEKISDTEIERLLEAEYNNEIYQRPMLVVSSELQAEIEKAENTLLEVELARKKAETYVKELRAKLLAEMERQGIDLWETEQFRVKKVYGYDKQQVDTAKLKKEYPMAYVNCQKITKVNPSIRVTVKGEENE